MSDHEHAILNLSPDEKRAFGYLFAQADKDQLGVVTGENAVSFFERTRVSPNVLGEIWQIADTENRGLLTKPGFCMVLRLIGHYQAGREPSSELAFKPGPVPKFEGLQIPGGGDSAVPSPTAAAFPPNALQPQLSGQAPIRVPPLDPQKVLQYSGLFERSGAQNGQLDGGTAKAIFERAGLPNEVLGKIWMLSDREQKGGLDQTEFIVAMHLLTSMKTRAMSVLPSTLPPGLYEAAARRGAPPPSRQATGPTAIPRQLTGSSIGAIPRTQSPLARPPGYGTPPPQSAQTVVTPWLITPADKAKFDQFFSTIDTQGRGVVSGEQAVSFFSDSRLPEDTLAQIWDLADINSEGQLNRDEFAVAMYLIRQQRAPNASGLPAFLPSALVPPSLRKQTQQTQSTAPVFDNANNTQNMPKSAADDLFGLDEPSLPKAQPQVPVLQPQGTGASASRDPFAGSSPGSPSSPARFQPPTQQPGSMFKPFMPTSAFGASLASQNTGGSVGSNQATYGRGFPQQPQQQTSVSDDLLGDNDTSVVESSKITNETTELANMSNQIGNLRSQMEQTQSKKSATQADLNATSTQKRDLELRLQQFRTQYEQEVRAVKELEQQLAASRESTKKLSQELAMLEGTYQDLQTQHQTITQALHADQQENAELKKRTSQINSEVTRLKPEIEKLKMDARQWKGMVSINRKQLSTNEGERDRLQTEKSDLESEAAEREEQARAAPLERIASPAAASNLASPAASTLSSTNPFFRKASNDGAADRSVGSPGPTSGSTGPKSSAFDTLFGPSATFSPSGQEGSRTGTPPATSFGNRSLPAVAVAVAAGAGAVGAAGMSDSIQSVSSVGEHTPAATPPLSEQARESPQTAAEPPPLPESLQFTASHLPVVEVDEKARDSDAASSTNVVPPASRAGEVETPRETLSSTDDALSLHVPGSFTQDPTPETAAKDHIPGAFPNDFWQQSTNGTDEATPLASSSEPPAAKDDFDSAFAGFGNSEKSKDSSREIDDPFAASSGSAAPIASHGFSSEFPPIQSLESEEDEDSDDESARAGFDDNYNSPRRDHQDIETSQRGLTEPLQSSSALAGITNVAAPITTGNVPEGLPAHNAQQSPPAYEDSNHPTHGGSGERTESNQFPPEFEGLLPAREDPTSPPPPDEPSSEMPTARSMIRELPPGSISSTPVPVTSSAFPAPPSRADVFHDASSRHVSDAPQSHAAPGKNAFDDFDEFDNLSPAQEADTSGTDFEFGFPGERSDEFNPTFDSPVSSTTRTQSTQQTPVPNRSIQQSESNGFSDFTPAVSTGVFGGGSQNGSIQQTPQNAQHDWDAIFSGLDKPTGVDTSLNTRDPWGSAPANGSASAAPAAAASSFPAPPPEPVSKPVGPDRGGAVTPGTEHDDPILKRLTGMGYPRQDALQALENFDYDINRAVDHLTSQ